jgi:hypothetical protein
VLLGQALRLGRGKQGHALRHLGKRGHALRWSQPGHLQRLSKDPDPEGIDAGTDAVRSSDADAGTDAVHKGV